MLTVLECSSFVHIPKYIMGTRTTHTPFSPHACPLSTASYYYVCKLPSTKKPQVECHLMPDDYKTPHINPSGSNSCITESICNSGSNPRNEVPILNPGR